MSLMWLTTEDPLKMTHKKMLENDYQEIIIFWALTVVVSKRLPSVGSSFANQG